jgi:hypothetical protein
VVGYGCLGLGALALVLAYLGVANTVDLPGEMAYAVSGGLGGLFLLGVAATMLLSADLHDEWRKLDRIERSLLARDRGGVVDVSDAAPRDAEVAVAGAGARATPAERRSTAMATLFALVAGAAVVGGWYRTATVADNGRAVGGFAVALVGVILLGVVAIVRVGSLATVVRQRQATVLAPIALQLDRPGGDRGRSQFGALAGKDSMLLAEGARHFHRRGCPAVAGVEASEVDPAETPAGVSACRLCDPAEWS